MLRSWTENLEGPPGVLQKEGKDVFGRNPPKVASDVLLCENCNQKIAASRFAQHLSKCMGVGGRTGSREASKRASARMQQFAEEQESIDQRISSMQQYVIPKEPTPDYAARSMATTSFATVGLDEFSAVDFETAPDMIPTHEALSEEDDGLQEHDDADDDDFDPSKKARKVHPRSAPESPLGYVSIAR